MMNVKELKGIDVHLKEIDRLIQLSPKRTVDRSQIRNPKEIERHEQMKQYALRLGINLYMTDDTESSYDKDKEESVCIRPYSSNSLREYIFPVRELFIVSWQKLVLIINQNVSRMVLPKLIEKPVNPTI